MGLAYEAKKTQKSFKTTQFYNRNFINVKTEKKSSKFSQIVTNNSVKNPVILKLKVLNYQVMVDKNFEINNVSWSLLW